MIQGVPLPQSYPSHPGSLPGTTVPQIGSPTPVAPGTVAPMPLPSGTSTPMPLPTGTSPEGIKEAPKEPLKLPGGERGVQPTSGTRIESEGRNPFDYHHRQQAPATGAADYSSMTGKLRYVHVDGGLWVLRYAPLDKVDANGGSVVLGGDQRLANYREGDIVTVKGAIIADRASTRLGGPLYRVDAIQLVERPTN